MQDQQGILGVTAGLRTQGSPCINRSSAICVQLGIANFYTLRERGRVSRNRLHREGRSLTLNWNVPVRCTRQTDIINISVRGVGEPKVLGRDEILMNCPQTKRGLSCSYPISMEPPGSFSDAMGLFPYLLREGEQKLSIARRGDNYRVR